MSPVKLFLDDKSSPMLDHPPYSPDLALCTKKQELLKRLTTDELPCFEQ